MNILIFKKGSLQFSEASSIIKNNSHLLCQNANGNSEIANAYLKYASSSGTDYIFLAIPEKRQTRSFGKIIHGFALVKETKTSLYIDVICAKGAGFKLLSKVESLAKHLGKLFITLSALPSAINAYRKFGFIHSEKKCNEDPVITKLGEALQYQRFKSSNKAVKDRKFATLLSELVKLKLVSDKKCRNVRQCSVNGYSMTKCII